MSTHILNNQTYIFRHQLQRIYRLPEKIEYVITEPPLLLSIIYTKWLSPCFNQLMLNQYNSMHNLNFIIWRNKLYSQNNRMQMLEESIRIDTRITQIIKMYDIFCQYVDGNREGATEIAETILTHQINHSE